MDAGLATIAGLLLIGLPIALLTSIVRGWRHWRAVPLVQKNHTRAGVGAFVLIALALYVLRGGGFSSSTELYCVACGAAFAGLWVVVGITGSQGARYDPMSIFWWSVAGIGSLALLSLKGLPL